MPFLKKHKTSLFEQKIEKVKRNGWRHMIFSTHKYPKDVYRGQWKNDYKEGLGLEISRHNILYRGEWLNGLKHGFGVLNKIIKDNPPEKIYSGCWCQGKKQGFGFHWYKNKLYKGYFFEDKKHGFGQMWWDDGQYYEGSWKNDLFHGDGLLVLVNGNRYKGQFANGKKGGPGIFYHRNTGQTQQGIWCNDICLSSTVEDAYFKQSATRPTPYPIPEVKNIF